MTKAAPWSQDLADLLSRVDTRLYIAGRWRPAASAATYSVTDPATGDELAAVADAGPQDALDALKAAHAASATWARTPARDRGEALRRAYQLVVERAEDFALLMTSEMGKPLAESRAEVTYGAEFLRWFGEEAPRVSGRSFTVPEGTNRVVTHHRPVGPCLLVTPWNFPLAMGTRKIGPALAAGCTVVLKPASATPLTSHLLVQVLEEAGVPAGVVNLLSTSHAQAATEPLLSDPRLRKLSFTGSTAVGRSLLAAAAPQVLRTSMELGGNAPFLVFPDADLDAAIDAAMVAKMRNGGEACTSANRFLVHESLAADFSTGLAERFASLVVGDGRAADTDLGPLIDPAAQAKVSALVTDATDRGAHVLTGGSTVDRVGTFYAPTVLSNVLEDARVLHEEIFGPVAPVTTFATEEEALTRANATDLGLIAYAFTHDVGRGQRLAERLEAGMIALNTGLVSNAAAPFGGIKHSGLGREGGAVGMDEYLETIAVSSPNPWPN